MAKVELQATGCAGGSSRICPSMSISEPPRSDRKRGLAKLRLDDGLLRGCSTRAGRPLQHCRALAIGPTRDEHPLPSGKCKRMVMAPGVVNISLREAREPLPDFLVRQNTDAERRLTFDILVECDLGTRQQADRNVRLYDRPD